jgi:hypothetical protein
MTSSVLACGEEVGEREILFEETVKLCKALHNLMKESKGYLGLGKYQGRDLDGQIADCTLCYMTYMVMALDKRLNDYETLGELFREQRQGLMALTLWQRVLDIIRRIMNALAELIGISAEELVDNIIRDEKSLEKYNVMIDALEQLDKAA